MKTIILTSIITLNSFFSIATEIESSASIKNVTVYSSSAEVNYKKKIALQKGKTTIIFIGLTPYIVANTLKMNLSNKNVSIISVTEKINHIRERKIRNSTIKALHDSILSIEYRVGLINVKREALEMEKNLLFRNGSIGGLSEGVLVAEIEKASTFFHKRYTLLNTKIYKMERDENRLKKQIKRNQSQIKQMNVNTTKAKSEIRVVVTCKTPQTSEFSFVFLTPKAGWSPIYDCKFEGVDKPIKFIFRANVFNASGTSWNNVSIKLSTANPTAGFNKPSLAANKKQSTTTNYDKIKFKKVKIRNTISEYNIVHKQTVPTDAKPYLVRVNNYEMKAKYHYLLVPKLDPFGFLMADITEWNKFDLIPGTTNIYNKGSYMGKTFLNTYTENDTLSVYFGKDKNVVAVLKEKRSNKERKLIGNYYIDKSTFDIVIKNNSSETFMVHVLDQIPVYKITSKLKMTVDGIENAYYNNKEGSLLWTFALEPAANKTIHYQYEVKIPKTVIGSYKSKRRSYRTISCPSF